MKAAALDVVSPPKAPPDLPKGRSLVGFAGGCFVGLTWTIRKTPSGRDIIYYVRTFRRNVFHLNLLLIRSLLSANFVSERADIINYVPTKGCSSYTELTVTYNKDLLPLCEILYIFNPRKITFKPCKLVTLHLEILYRGFSE